VLPQGSQKQEGTSKLHDRLCQRCQRCQSFVKGFVKGYKCGDPHIQVRPVLCGLPCAKDGLHKSAGRGWALRGTQHAHASTHICAHAKQSLHSECTCVSAHALAWVHPCVCVGARHTYEHMASRNQPSLTECTRAHGTCRVTRTRKCSLKTSSAALHGVRLCLSRPCNLHTHKACPRPWHMHAHAHQGTS